MTPQAEQLTKLAEAAFLHAAKKLREEANRHGRKLIIWRDGAVQEVDPYTIDLPQEPVLPGLQLPPE
jgi:hypothetical protein